MATVTFAIGNIDEYDERKEDFNTYIERLEHWRSANAIKVSIAAGDSEQQEPDRRVSVLLTGIGAKPYSVLRDLLTRAKPREKNCNDLIDTLRLHFK